jgi:hypothetical protein
MGSWASVLPVINPHMAVGVEETQSRSAQRDPLLSQSLAELGGPSGGGQTRQFAPQRFDFRRPVQPQHAPQVLGRVFLETLRAFDAPERHEQEREQAGAQPIKGRAETAVDFLRALEHAAGDQDRQRQEHSGARHGRGGAKERRRIFQQTQTRQQPVGAAVTRIGIVAGDGTLLAGATKSGQV